MAKLISDKSNYDANNEYLDDIEPNKNNIVLSIKTDAKYADHWNDRVTTY